MTEPITAAIIAGLAAQKFAEGAAGKAAEKLIERLWEAIATRFKGRKKAEGELAKIAAAKGAAPEAIANVTRALDGEMFEDDQFREQLEAIVREIRAAEPTREASISGVVNSSGANAVNAGVNQGTINYTN
jgi:dephospho-CoA kinase